MSNCRATILACGVLLSMASCTRNEVIIEPVPLYQEFEVSATDYCPYHYLVDTSYVDAYEQYYLHEPPLVIANKQIREIEVWVQREGSFPYPNERRGIAWLHLPPKPFTRYDSSYQRSADYAGSIESGSFLRLQDRSFFLEGNGYTGEIVVHAAISSDQQIVAVAYRRADGVQIGEFERDRPSDTTGVPIVLKLVKPKNIYSITVNYPVPWKMVLKNYYPLRPYSPVSRHGFSLHINRKNEHGEGVPGINGHPLLRVLGFDSYSNEGIRLPDGDGIFDFCPYRTITQDISEIRFPMLRPFDSGIKSYFTGRSLPLPGLDYYFPELYDMSRSDASQSPRNKYVIRGRGIFD